MHCMAYRPTQLQDGAPVPLESLQMWSDTYKSSPNVLYCTARACTAYMYNFVLKLTRCTRQETPDPAHVSGPLRGKGDGLSRLGCRCYQLRGSREKQTSATLPNNYSRSELKMISKMDSSFGLRQSWQINEVSHGRTAVWTVLWKKLITTLMVRNAFLLS